MKMVRVVRPNGTEGEIPESAFEKVWKDRGYTLAEEQRPEAEQEDVADSEVSEEGTSVRARRRGKPDSTATGESEENAEADAEADESGG